MNKTIQKERKTIKCTCGLRITLTREVSFMVGILFKTCPRCNKEYMFSDNKLFIEKNPKGKSMMEEIKRRKKYDIQE